jgi:hypothetical protein
MVQRSAILENYYALNLIKNPDKSIQEKALTMATYDCSEVDIIKYITNNDVLINYIKKNPKIILDLKHNQINLELVTIVISKFTQEENNELIRLILRKKDVDSEMLNFLYDYGSMDLKNKIKKHKKYKTIAQIILNKIKDQD